MALVNRLHALFAEADALVEQAKTAEKAAVSSLKLNANEKFRQAYKVYVDSILIMNNPLAGWISACCHSFHSFFLAARSFNRFILSFTHNPLYSAQRIIKSFRINCLCC